MDTLKNEGRSDVNDDLLIKFTLDETSQEENEAIYEWVDKDEAYRKHLADFELIKGAGKVLASKGRINEEYAWERFKHKRSQRVRSAQAGIKINGIRFIDLKVAATLIFIVVAGWASYKFYWELPEGTSMFRHVKTAKEVLVLTLPDGSVVTMNKHTRLTYPKVFNDTARTVALEFGEAFFEITPDKSKPFIVQVNDVTIEVLGTSFNIKNGQRATEVIVESGKVQVKRKDSIALLTREEKLLIKPEEVKFVKEIIQDRLHTYYRNNELIAHHTPLWRVVEVLNEAYAANIIIEKEALKELTLTATFKNETLDNILQIIQKTFGIEVVKKDKEILLR